MGELGRVRIHDEGPAEPGTEQQSGCRLSHSDGQHITQIGPLSRADLAVVNDALDHNYDSGVNDGHRAGLVVGAIGGGTAVGLLTAAGFLVMDTNNDSESQVPAVPAIEREAPCPPGGVITLIPPDSGGIEVKPGTEDGANGINAHEHSQGQPGISELPTTTDENRVRIPENTVAESIRNKERPIGG